MLGSLSGCGGAKPLRPMPTTEPQEWRSELNPQMSTVIRKLEKLGPKPLPSLSPELARRQPGPADAMLQVLQDKGVVKIEPQPAVGRVEMRTIPGPNNTQLPVRVYTPKGEGPFPVIVYFHGGGWVIGSIDAYDASCRGLAQLTSAVVVAVNYRKAPEHKFPAAHEDAYAAVQHVIENTANFGGTPGRVTVAGESAGGNLATAACIMAYERNGRMPLHQLLVYPITNHALTTETYQAYAHAKPLNATMMAWFFQQYLRTNADGASTMVSPLRAADAVLRNLPPATVILAQIDPLRSEGAAYAAKLKAAGVDVRSRVYNGVTHEFFGLAAVLDKAKDAQRFAADRLKDSFRHNR